jgi:hypothetical protein
MRLSLLWSSQKRQAYPLATDNATGALTQWGFRGHYHDPSARQVAHTVLRLRQGTQSIDTRFTWDGVRFVSIPALTASGDDFRRQGRAGKA